KEKLRDALETTADLDLWVLVRTQETKEPDWSELKQTAAEQGVELLSLDWRTAPGSLPPLAAVCAADPRISKAYLGDEAEPVLQAIAGHPECSREVENIRAKLIAPD